MRVSKSTAFECLTRNPLLMFRGCNPIPHEITKTQEGKENPNLSAYKQFHNLYNEALKITSTNNLVFGLEADYSDNNEGLGGFAEADYIPLGW